MTQRLADKNQPQIVRMVRELLGDRLLEIRRFKEGGSTRTYQSTLEEKPVVLKFWKEEIILTSIALRMHNNNIALHGLFSRKLITTSVPVMHHSFILTEEGLLVPLPIDKCIEDKKMPQVGAIINQLMIMQDISCGGRYELSDGMTDIPSGQKTRILDDFETITQLIGGDANSLRGFLSYTPITAISEPPVTYFADIDKLPRIPYPFLGTVELAEIIEQHETSPGKITRHEMIKPPSTQN